MGVGLFEVERPPVMIIRKALFPALLSALSLTNGKIVLEVKVVDKYASVKKMVVDPKNGLPARTIASGGWLVS